MKMCGHTTNCGVEVKLIKIVQTWKYFLQVLSHLKQINIILKYIIIRLKRQVLLKSIQE